MKDWSRPDVRQGFTLIELLVVISIIAVLIGVLLPTLARARHSARAVQDLSQYRQMETAHHAFMVDHDGKMINAGLPHGTVPTTPELAWVVTLREYYQTELVTRSPLDDSPHWPGGQPVPHTPGGVYRQTSYGINNFLTDVKHNGRNPWGGTAWTTLDRVGAKRSPTELVHFLPMAYEGDFAGADHPHVETWDAFGSGGSVVAAIAGDQVQTHAVFGPAKSFESVANWGFLDGHAAAVQFVDLYQHEQANQFDPDADPAP